MLVERLERSGFVVAKRPPTDGGAPMEPSRLTTVGGSALLVPR
jgi:hypothetical protein